MDTESNAFIHTVTGSTLHNLWHHCLCHTGKFATDHINKVEDGVLCLHARNPFFSCQNCSDGKMTTKIKGYKKEPDRATQICRRFNMDYGFVRGNDTIKNEHGPLITSKNGYNCYLMIVDEYSRYMWLFLFSDKTPPIVTTKSFLNTHSLKDRLRHIRTDQGGELIKSTEFRQKNLNAGYTLERTGAGASFQNSIAERPHRTLAAMMRTMLAEANPSSKYWAHAIKHA